MILDWHEDRRTRCNLALREYLRTSELHDPRVLILNMSCSDYYLIYDGNKMVYCGDFWTGGFRQDEEHLFEVDFPDHQDWNMRFGELKYHELAWEYSELAYAGVSAYCLDDQEAGSEWQPDWGNSVVQTELIYAHAQVNHTTVDGVVCDLFNWEDGVNTADEYSMFIPFDFTHPPARNFVGCQVDGTFFLLFNHVESNSC